MINQVFISYRHESPEHARAVHRLGELLRQAKLPVMLDQFYLDEKPGGPNEGWPKWCEDCANHSACVIVVASAGWFAAYDKTAEPGIGLGAASEADLFRQALYDEQGNNARIRLSFLHELPTDSVPARLRAWHQFRPLSNDQQLEQLIRWAADRLGLQNIELPTVRWPQLVNFKPDLADRIDEWPVIQNLLSGQQRKRIVLIEGGNSGLGKSALLHETRKYARKLNIPMVWVDFKGGGMDIAHILGQFDLELGSLLPNFSLDSSKVNFLRKDLRALRQPVLLMFDSYEAIAENPSIANWLSQQLLNEVETSLGLCIIVAGQKVPPHSDAGWRDLAMHVSLQPITELEHWQPWVERRYPGFADKGAHLPTVLMYTGGNPALVSDMCAVIAGH